MNQQQAVGIYEVFAYEILEDETWYKNIHSSIKATLLYGSIAKGLNREDSDIDILIIVPLDAEKRFTKGEYVYYYKKYEINIVLRSIEKMRLIAEEQKDIFQKEVFRDSVIINSSKEVRDLLIKISNIIAS